MFFSKLPAILIDSENVGSTWTGLLSKDERFELYICVTENAKSLNFTLLKQLTDEHRYKINIIECKPGKNSLDFYLSSYLGYLIGKNKHSSYTVVSQDTGYDSVIEYWCNEGYDVKRINTKPETPKKASRKSSKKKSEPMPQKNPQKKDNRQLPVLRKQQLPSLQVNDRQKTENKPQQRPENKASETDRSHQISSEKRVILKDMNKENKRPVQNEPKKEIRPVQNEAKKENRPVQNEVKKEAVPVNDEVKKEAVPVRNEVKKEEAAVKKEEPVQKKKTASKKQPKKKEASENKEAEQKNEVKAERKTVLAKDTVKEVLKELPENEAEEIIKYLDKVPQEKRADKNYIYRGLVRKFKREKGLAFYSLVKKDLERFYRQEDQQ
ncbi:MAG: hypothetical protein K5648_09385 [Erysipelotrichaceae bacterium]|nr:hypothetical protein [Erysipelotrichaceae bacterium]